MSNTPSTPKHSPGPWLAHPHNGNTAIHSSGWQIGSVIGKDAQAKADAALISAAPNLLVRLIECEAVLSAPGAGHEGGEWIEEVRAAIAKAMVVAS